MFGFSSSERTPVRLVASRAASSEAKFGPHGSEEKIETKHDGLVADTYRPVVQSTVDIVRDHVPSLTTTGDFDPPYILSFGNAQTIFTFSTKLHIPVTFDRDMLHANDGGMIALDFVSAPWLRPDSPIAIILPGISGSSEDMYIKSAALKLSMQDEGGDAYRVVVVNTRGGKYCPLTTPYLTHAGSTDDLRLVVKCLNERFPGATALFGLGFSMGGGLLANYLAEEGETCPMTAGFCVSTVWDLEVCSKRIEESLFRRFVYSYSCGSELGDTVRRNESIFRQARSEGLQGIVSTKNIRLKTFNDTFMSKLAGYEDTTAFAAGISPIFKLSHVRRPCILLHAIDDPFYGDECLNDVEKVVEDMDYDGVLLAVTRKGGHVAWVQRDAEGNLEQWFVHPVREFFDSFGMDQTTYEGACSE